ncbi:Uncharacterised protein [Mesomycoplasma conjunctivae]|nr:Uncharacterised protein [Mesomycoplasma conjunctivae]
MKKPNFKTSLIIGLSAVAALTIVVAPIVAVRAKANDYQRKLNASSQEIAKAVAFKSNFDFTRDDFIQLASSLTVNEAYKNRISAQSALDLHNDKTYSFELIDIVDLSPLKAKAPNMQFELRTISATEDANNVTKAEGGEIKGAILIGIDEKNKLYYSSSANILGFASPSTNAFANFIIDQNTSKIQLSSASILKYQSPSTLAIAFQKTFEKELAANNNQNALAFAKTVAAFGGLSLFDQTQKPTILPANYSLAAKVDEQNRLSFAKVDSSTGELSIILELINSNNNEKQEVILNFSKISGLSQNLTSQLASTFSKYYKIKDNLANLLATNKLSLAQVLYSSTIPSVLAQSDEFKDKSLADIQKFDFWFEQRDQQQSLQFDTEKNGIQASDFSIDFPKTNGNESQFSAPDASVVANLINNGEIMVTLKFNSNVNKSDKVPNGVDLIDGKDELSQKIDVVVDARGDVYKTVVANYFKNTNKIEVDPKSNINIAISQDDLDAALSPFLGKKLSSQLLEKSGQQLFSILDRTGVEIPSDSGDDQKTPAGQYLKSILENLLTQNHLPENTFIELQSSYFNNYALEIILSDAQKVITRFSLPIANVVKSNLAYNAATAYNADIFVDFSNASSSSEQKYKTNSLINNKFQWEADQSDIEVQKDGIQIKSEKSLTLSNTEAIKTTYNKDASQLTNVKDGLIYLAFKPSQLPTSGKLYLLKSDSKNPNGQVNIFIQKAPDFQTTPNFEKFKDSYLIGLEYQGIKSSNSVTEIPTLIALLTKSKSFDVLPGTESATNVSPNTDNKILSIIDKSEKTAKENILKKFDNLKFFSFFNGGTVDQDFAIGKDQSVLLEIRVQENRLKFVLRSSIAKDPLGDAIESEFNLKDSTSLDDSLAALLKRGLDFSQIGGKDKAETAGDITFQALAVFNKNATGDIDSVSARQAIAKKFIEQYFNKK